MKILKSLLAISAFCLIAAPIYAQGKGDAAPKKGEPAPGKGAIIKTLSADQLMEILAKEGLVPERAKETVIRVKMDQIRVLFFVSESKENIQAYAGFESDDTSLKKINQWNAEKRFSRAYLDDDDDPVIELDLDLEGGITQERLIDFITTVRVSVSQFRKHIYE